MKCTSDVEAVCGFVMFLKGNPIAINGPHSDPLPSVCDEFSFEPLKMALGCVSGFEHGAKSVL